jgi:hypothetical protein
MGDCVACYRLVIVGDQSVSDQQSPQEYFRLLLLTVVGQAFGAAGYALEEREMQWAGGLFRFAKHFENGLYGFIEFQLLHYHTEIPEAQNSPSRFRVTLIRSDQANAVLPSKHPQYVRRTLSALVVDDFDVHILPSGEHWWTFRDVTELGKALAESGHLIIGFGIPWLAGDLQPKAHD